MKTLSILALIVTLNAGSALAMTPMPEPETSRTIAFLEKTTLREQTFTEVQLSDACDYLDQLTKDYDPAKQGLKFRLNPELQKEIKKKPKLVSFTGTNLLNIVNRLCFLYSLSYSIENDTITFKKKI